MLLYNLFSTTSRWLSPTFCHPAIRAQVPLVGVRGSATADKPSLLLSPPREYMVGASAHQMVVSDKDEQKPGEWHANWPHAHTADGLIGSRSEQQDAAQRRDSPREDTTHNDVRV